MIPPGGGAGAALWFLHSIVLRHVPSRWIIVPHLTRSAQCDRAQHWQDSYVRGVKQDKSGYLRVPAHAGFQVWPTVVPLQVTTLAARLKTSASAHR